MLFRSIVVSLKKSLNDLKQSPRQWYKRFDDFMMRMNFQRYNYDNCVYILKRDEEVFLYLLVYVVEGGVVAGEERGVRHLQR